MGWNCRALSLAQPSRAPGGTAGPAQDTARCKHSPGLGVPACPCSCTRGCRHGSCTGHSSELAPARRHAGLLQKKLAFWSLAACVQRGERGEEAQILLQSCCFLLRVQLQPCPPSPGAGAMLPAPRPPSVCPSRCPFSLLAASSGRTISSRLMVTALASVLKSMVPISAWPGRRCCRRCSEQPRVLPSLGTASALPPRAAPALPAAPSGLCQSRP